MSDSITMPRVSETIEWIPVGETLPDDGETVLLVWDDAEVWPGYRCDGGWIDAGSAVEVSCPLYWAHMPAGPV